MEPGQETSGATRPLDPPPPTTLARHTPMASLRYRYEFKFDNETSSLSDRFAFESLRFRLTSLRFPLRFASKFRIVAFESFRFLIALSSYRSKRFVLRTPHAERVGGFLSFLCRPTYFSVFLWILMYAHVFSSASLFSYVFLSSVWGRRRQHFGLDVSGADPWEVLQICQISGQTCKIPRAV